MLKTYGQIKSDTSNLNKNLVHTNFGADVIIQNVKFNSIEIKVNSPKPDTLKLFQNNYPNWTAQVNKKNSKIHKKLPYLNTKIEEGTSTIKFFYEPSYIPFVLVLSIISISVTFLGSIILSVKT